jgi:hypothetical protein
MNNDPIVKEVRTAREKLAARFDYDLAAIITDLQRREILLGDRLVNLRARRNSARKKVAR